MKVLQQFGKCRLVALASSVFLALLMVVTALPHEAIARSFERQSPAQVVAPKNETIQPVAKLAPNLIDQTKGDYSIDDLLPLSSSSTKTNSAPDLPDNQTPLEAKYEDADNASITKPTITVDNSSAKSTPGYTDLTGRLDQQEISLEDIDAVSSDKLLTIRITEGTQLITSDNGTLKQISLLPIDNQALTRKAVQKSISATYEIQPVDLIFAPEIRLTSNAAGMI